MIPKTIHYIWVGPNPLDNVSRTCIETWKQKLLDYEFRLWNETNIGFDDCKYAVEAYSAGKFAYVSDYLRLKVLCQNGGIYMDTDVELLKNLDGCLYNAGFVGWEKSPTRDYYMIGAEILGCEKNNPIFGELLNSYRDRSFIINGNSDPVPITCKLTEVLVKHGLEKNRQQQVVDGICVYSNEYFYPRAWNNPNPVITDKTAAIHHYRMSWAKG